MMVGAQITERKPQETTKELGPGAKKIFEIGEKTNAFLASGSEEDLKAIRKAAEPPLSIRRGWSNMLLTARDRCEHDREFFAGRPEFTLIDERFRKVIELLTESILTAGLTEGYNNFHS